MEKVQMVNLVKMNYGCASMQDLISLVSSFLSEVKTYDKDPDKLTDTIKKDNVKNKCRIKERLVFFNTIYKEMSEPKSNVNYLSAMSDLLAIYIDLEVITCSGSLVPEKKKKSERKDHYQKKMDELMSKIVTSLYTMLCNSEGEILDTVLKLRPPPQEDPSNEMYHRIYASIYRYVVNRAANRQIDDLTYVRYVLIYKLWDYIAKDSEKEAIVKQAAARLRPPPGFRERRRTLPRILPKPSKEIKNITDFFLKKKFDVVESVKILLKATSRAANQYSMFPNIRCKPLLMNPSSLQTPQEPAPLPNGSAEGISTLQSMADDLWMRLRCEEPLSETSLFYQVTNLKQPPKLSVTKLYKMLNRHKVQVKKKSSKKSPKKNSLPRVSAAEKGGYLNVGRCPKDGGEAVLQVTPDTKSRKTTKQGERNNEKRSKPVDFPEPPVLKKVKIEFWDPANHVPVNSSYDKKKDPPVVSAAVSPFIANITKPSGSQVTQPAVPPTEKERKPNTVDASVSTVDDFEWTMNFSKQSPNRKKDPSWQQSCSTFPDNRQPSFTDRGVQSVFEKPASHKESQTEDQMRVSLDGSAGILEDSQFGPDVSELDLDESVWGLLNGSQYSGHVDPMTYPLLHEWSNDCTLDVLSTPVYPDPQDNWVHDFS